MRSNIVFPAWIVIAIIPNPYDPRRCKTLLAVPQCDAVQGTAHSPPSLGSSIHSSAALALASSCGWTKGGAGTIDSLLICMLAFSPVIVGG